MKTRPRWSSSRRPSRGRQDPMGQTGHGWLLPYVGSAAAWWMIHEDAGAEAALPCCICAGERDRRLTGDSALARHGLERGEREAGDVALEPIEGVLAVLEVAVEEVEARLGHQVEVGRPVPVGRRVPATLDRHEELWGLGLVEEAMAGGEGKFGVRIAVEEQHRRR